MAVASLLVLESDPVARARITQELRALGYDVGDSEVVPAHKPEAAFQEPESITAGGVTIDQVGHRVIVDGDFVALAPREYRLLLFLLSNQDRVFSRDQLLVHVWDRDATVGSRTVDVHIRRLRSLLEPYKYERYIQTVRGAGYRFSLKA